MTKLNKIKELMNLDETLDKNEVQEMILDLHKDIVKKKLNKNESIIEREFFKHYGKHRDWNYRLGQVIAEHFSCRIIKRKDWKKSNMVIIGYKQDVDIVTILVNFGLEFCKRTAIEYGRKVEKEIGKKATTAKNEYIQDFIVTMITKFENNATINEKRLEKIDIYIQERTRAQYQEWVSKNLFRKR